ncbi:hypothetical protein PRIPAC_84567, partial [Pristionchus pacificus]
VQPKTKKENKDDLHKNVNPDTAVQSDEQTKKGTGDNELNIGTIIIICVSSLIVLIIIAVIVGSVIQCLHNKKSARRKNKLESAVQKARKNEPPRKESTPLIPSMTPTTNQITESNSDRTV